MEDWALKKSTRRDTAGTQLLSPSNSSDSCTDGTKHRRKPSKNQGRLIPVEISRGRGERCEAVKGAEWYLDCLALCCLCRGIVQASKTLTEGADVPPERLPECLGLQTRD